MWASVILSRDVGFNQMCELGHADTVHLRGRYLEMGALVPIIAVELQSAIRVLLKAPGE